VISTIFRDFRRYLKLIRERPTLFGFEEEYHLLAIAVALESLQTGVGLESQLLRKWRQDRESHAISRDCNPTLIFSESDRALADRQVCEGLRFIFDDQRRTIDKVWSLDESLQNLVSRMFDSPPLKFPNQNEYFGIALIDVCVAASLPRICLIRLRDSYAERIRQLHRSATPLRMADLSWERRWIFKKMTAAETISEQLKIVEWFEDTLTRLFPSQI